MMSTEENGRYGHLAKHLGAGVMRMVEKEWVGERLVDGAFLVTEGAWKQTGDGFRDGKCRKFAATQDKVAE